MKGALIGMVVVVAALAVALIVKGEGAWLVALKSSGKTGLKLVPIIALALLMMGAAEVLLDKALVERWLSDASGIRGILLAWVAGAATPGGSIVGMPIAAGLLKAGAGPVVLVTYLTSLATLSFVRVPLEVSLIGGRLTTLRVIACLLLPPIAGAITRGVLFLSRGGL